MLIKKNIHRFLKSNYASKFIWLLIAILVNISTGNAQVVPPQDNNEIKTEEKIEKAAEQNDENVDYEELQQTLEEYRKNKINLNTASREQFQNLQLLNELQISNLINYIASNGKLIALEELQAIDGFDAATIEDLLPFVTIGEVNNLHYDLKGFLKAGTNQVLVRSYTNLNDQYGYTVTDTSQNRYLGPPWSLYVRYRFSFSPKYSFGITAEKDAGEEFFKGTQKQGFDYYSAHLFIKDIGVIKKIALGDYQLEYGQGVAVWSGLAFGKSPDITTVKRNARGLLPYTSVNEESFRRGAAVSVGLGKWTLDAWYSNRKTDGNLVAQDSLQTEFIVSSLQSSGLHRTPSEVADKNSITVQSYGSHLKFNHKNLEAGLTISQFELEVPITRSEALYNKFEYSGNKFMNVALDYNWSYQNLILFGEAARSDNNSYGMLYGALMALDPHFALSLVYRNYQKNFYAIESNALRESNNFNEKGMLLGSQIKLSQPLTLSGYADLFSYPWLRFGVNSPTYGSEYLAQLNYRPNKKLEMYARWRQTIKGDNTLNTVALDYTVPVKQTGYRFTVNYAASKAITLRTRIEYVQIKREDADDNNGLLIYQDVFFKPMESRFTFSIRYAIFDTKDYDSRVYGYENDVYGTFSIPSYYDKGMRYYLNIRYVIFKHFDVYARISQTVYTNKTTVGSGLDLINNNKKADFHVALKMDF